MKKTIIFSIVATVLMLAMPAQAKIIKGYVLINGDQVSAEYTKLSDNTVSVGSGKNSCIPQYTAGHLTIPSTITVDGTTYNVTQISNVAFRFCDQIKSVEIRENVTRIGNFAFVGCKSLADITLPASLESIGSGAFINTVTRHSEGSVTCLGETPPRWEYNDVFMFHSEGIGDPNAAVISAEIKLYVPEGAKDAYHNANYTNSEIGWNGADGWGSFSSYFIGMQAVHVYTPADLKAIHDIVNDHGKYNYYKNIYIENDLDFNNQEWDGGIGNDETHPFAGNFYGNGHTISNLKISSRGPTGLFSYFGGHTAENITLKNITATSPTGNSAGVFAGVSGYSSYSYIWVENCSLNIATGDMGMILGRCITNGGAMFNNCVVNNCKSINCDYPSASTQGFGGIVGYCYGGRIKNCAVIGDVDFLINEPFVGRCEGTNEISVNNCYATDNKFQNYNAPDNVKYNNVVLCGKNTFNMTYPDGTVAEKTISTERDFKSLFMIPILGLVDWTFMDNYYPLPINFENKLPVDVNIAEYRPYDPNCDRLNALMMMSTTQLSTFNDLSESGYRANTYVANRLWIDENFPYNDNVPESYQTPYLPIGTATIECLNGVRFDRTLEVTSNGTEQVTVPNVKLDEEGNPMTDENGDYIIDGEVTLYEEETFAPTGYMVYLPYELHHNNTFHLFVPESVESTNYNYIASLVMNEIDDAIIYPWTPYYLVVTDVPVDLSTEDDLTIEPEPESTSIFFGPDLDYSMCGTKNPTGFEDNKFVINDLDLLKPATTTINAWESYFTAPDVIERIEINRELRLYDNKDNNETIEDFDGTKVKATLRGRTLYKDGTWNTLCLPFDVPNHSGSLIEDAVIYELNYSEIADDGTVTMNFSHVYGISAGRPCLVKWESGENIVNPSFYGVTIYDEGNKVEKFGPISMMGNYEPTFVPKDATILYVGANNQLCRPTNDMTINAFRAYFYYNSKVDPENLGSIKLNFEEPGVVTDIEEVPIVRPVDTHWYTIDGRVLPGKPSVSGIYINNGKKVIIK